MTIEALKKQLAEGKLTKEQFAAELKKLLDAGTIDQATHDAAIKEADTNSGGGNGGGALTAEQVQAMINEAVKKAEQSAGDKVRTEYAAKLKAEQEEKERLLKEKMTEEEKAKFELEKLRTENEQKAAELTKKEVTLHTIDQLRAKALPLEFRDILAGSSVDDTNEKIVAFEKQWTKALSDAVEERFKSTGTNPNKGRDGNPGGTATNPFLKETLNLTKQAELIRTNPSLAKQYASAVGITLNGI